MITALTIERIRPVYDGGIAGAVRVASGFDDAAWSGTACGHWDAAQTARHMLAVAHWYHAWLDRALGGDAAPPFPPSEMAQQNERALEPLQHLSGPQAIAAFTDTAAGYLRRAADAWDRPFGYPYGTVTVGLHAGVAAVEWHLHAWDLSTLGDRHHRPDDPQTLSVAAARCVAAAQGGVRSAVTRGLAPLASRRQPWTRLLRYSGRAEPA